MDDLTYGLRQLCQRNRDGSHATQGDRLRSLMLMARHLREAGFRRMTPRSLNERHAEALLGRWWNEGLTAGTLKNRLAHLRWWAEKVRKEGIVPNVNSELGVPMRQFVADESKARELGDHLDRITDPHVHASLSLQQAFGLRREESIKFQPSYADRGDHIVLKGSWTKGGRERLIPITTREQRVALDQVQQLAGSGSLIPPHKTYIEQRHVYACGSWQCLQDLHSRRSHQRSILIGRMRRNFAEDPPRSAFSNLQVVLRLQVHPELRGGSEVFAESQRRVGSNRTRMPHDVIHARRLHADCLG